MMRSNRTARLRVSSVSALVLLATACSDESGVAKAPAQMTQPAVASAAAVRARDRIQETNRHAWVGAAHNAALKELKAEIAEPGTPKSLCRLIADFASRPERIPSQQRADHVLSQRELRSELEATLCTESRRRGRPRLVAMRGATAVIQTETLDAATNELLNAVETAIQNANDSYDLAGRLDPILTAANSLDTTGRAAVEIAVSIAQSSVENAEAELPSYVTLIDSEYGTCAESHLMEGYSFDDSRFLCTEGKDREYEMFNPGAFRSRMQAVVSRSTGTTTRRCVGLKNGWKRVGSVDVKSGIGGFIGGLIKTKSLQGAGLYALASSVGGSGSEYVHVAWDMWRCAME